MITWAVTVGLLVGALICIVVLGWPDRDTRLLRAVEQDLWDRLAVGACEWIP